MSPGTEALLGGRYLLRARIAGGGMGEVWSATDQALGRDVAVKVLRREYADDPTFLERFRAEARNAAGLSHPGVAAVYDYGEDDGSPYLVMERVVGEPLSDLISREGRLGTRRTLDLVGQAALALDAAHQAGVVHRDVKPGNLLVTPEGRIKVTDFGISRATDAVPLTRTGSIMGTAYYISPEQASGTAVTPASDIYSLGVVAYECLSGRRPFTGDTPVSVALAQVREEPPALPPDTPGPARDLVMRMLAKDPAARPASAGELGRTALALRDAAEQEPWAPAGGGAQGGDAADREPWAHAGRGPGEGGGTDTNPGFALPPPRRSGRTLRAAAVLVVGVAALALLLRACTGSDPTAATSTQQGVAAAPATTTPGTPAGVAVDAERYVGRPAVEVARELRALGLLVDLDDVDGNGPVGSVAAVAPDGMLPPDSVVTVTVVRAAAERPRLDRGAEGRGGDKEGRGPGKKGRDKERDDEKDDD